ncbi:MAG: PD-(D/E)XK nuclease family protein [Thermotogae bacterium]|nr:PD-(D/E)XK nuclease family protein [Thermotogota bacterium]
MRKLRGIHESDPFSYTFVGSSGGYVKAWADRFARMMGSSIPRSKFLTIDQFAVQLYLYLHPHRIHVDDEIMALFLSDIVTKFDEELMGELARVRSSPRLVTFTLEAIKEIEENGLEKFLEDISDFPQTQRFIRKVYEELYKRFSDRIFNTFRAYREVEPGGVEKYIREYFGRYLFISGFFDLSTAHMDFLRKIIPLYDEVFISRDPVLWNNTNWRKFLGQLGDTTLDIVKLRFPDDEPPLFNFLLNVPGKVGKGIIEFLTFRDTEEEVTGVCKKIKKEIVDGAFEPGEIGIVLNNFSERAGEFERRLREYGVPVRVEGDETLASSRLIQLITLPLRTASAGYPVEHIMSLMDHGYGVAGVPSLTAEDMERIARKAVLHADPLRTSLSRRKEGWFDKLKSLLKVLETRGEDLEGVEREEIEVEREICRRFMKHAEKVFELLEPLESAKYAKKPAGFYTEQLMNIMKNFDLSIVPGEEKFYGEYIALVEFSRAVHDLEILLEGSGIAPLKLDEYLTFLDVMLNVRRYKPEPDLGNRVEIMSLESARFKWKKWKVVIDFIDGVFPSLRYNPLYPVLTIEEGSGHVAISYYEKKSLEQLENLYSTMVTSGRVSFCVPLATREGESLVPSVWIRRLEKTLGVRYGPETVEVLEAPMSERELRTSVVEHLSSMEEQDEDFRRIVEDILAWKAEMRPSWRIKNGEILRALVGDSLSYTRLSLYNKCPLRFFFRYVLKLRGGVMEGCDLSALEVGIIYHRVLKEFFDEFWPLPITMKVDDLEKQVEDLVGKALADFLEYHGIRRNQVIRASLLGRLKAYLMRYLRWEEKKADNVIRVSTERPFSVELSLLSSYIPETARKYGALKFVGKIDRVDVIEKNGEEQLLISDYKRKKGSRDIQQLHLYALVHLASLAGRVDHARATFKYVEDAGASRESEVLVGERKIIWYSQRRNESSFDDVDRELLKLLDGIYEERTFERNVKQCYGCDYAHLCGVVSWLEDEKSAERE